MGAKVPSIELSPPNGQPCAVDMRLELRPVLLEVARDRVHGEVAERAQGLPEHPVADLIEEIEVRALAPPLLELGQDLHQPARTDAAGVHLPQDSCM